MIALDLFYVGDTRIGIADWLAWSFLGLIVLGLVLLAWDEWGP